MEHQLPTANTNQIPTAEFIFPMVVFQIRGNLEQLRRMLTVTVMWKKQREMIYQIIIFGI